MASHWHYVIVASLLLSTSIASQDVSLDLPQKMHSTQCEVKILGKVDDNGEAEMSLEALIESARTVVDTLRLTVVDLKGRRAEFVFRPISNLLSADVLQDSSGLSCHMDDSAAGGSSALSACDVASFSGLLRVGQGIFVLGASTNQRFYLAPQNADGCGSFATSLDVQLSSMVGAMSQRRPMTVSVPEYYSKYRQRTAIYIKLSLTADRAMYLKYGKSETAVKGRLVAIANIASSLYRPLNIHIQLAAIDVWSVRDEAIVSKNSSVTLDTFIHHRAQRQKTQPVDCAHLLTQVTCASPRCNLLSLSNVQFDESVLGLAPVGTMCWRHGVEQSAGIDYDHSANAAEVGTTLAHEMGHNLGLDHDAETRECTWHGEKAIMHPTTSQEPPNFFSECSLRVLADGFRSNKFACLTTTTTAPSRTTSTRLPPSGPWCGNGLVETSEECDVKNKCCDQTMCLLRPGAKCAAGRECDLTTCRPKTTAKTPCPSDCSGFGRCSEQSTCVCQSGYTGIACDVRQDDFDLMRFIRTHPYVLGSTIFLIVALLTIAAVVYCYLRSRRKQIRRDHPLLLAEPPPPPPTLVVKPMMSNVPRRPAPGRPIEVNVPCRDAPRRPPPTTTTVVFEPPKPPTTTVVLEPPKPSTKPPKPPTKPQKQFGERRTRFQLMNDTRSAAQDSEHEPIYDVPTTGIANENCAAATEDGSPPPARSVRTLAARFEARH